MITRTSFIGLVCAVFVGFAAAPVMAGSHLWRIHEVFSNADGSIQFIEMKECCGGNYETGLLNKWILSDATSNQFFFPANLPVGTANKHLLLATQAFADLPGAPTPDYIIGENFLDPSADTLTYWLYTAATFTFSAYELPTDGLHSLVCLANNSSGCTAFNIEVNSPTNFAGQSGSVNVGLPCADLNSDGVVGAFDLAILLGAWGTDPGGPPDFDGNGDVGAFDLAILLGAWGPCS